MCCFSILWDPQYQRFFYTVQLIVKLSISRVNLTHLFRFVSEMLAVKLGNLKNAP